MQLRLVIVSPKFSGNVGAIGRLAANFAVSDTRIVTPRCDWKGPQAQVFAMGAAAETLQTFREESCLYDALRGARAAIGFTRRSAGYARQPSLDLPAVASFVSHGVDVALVFGSEETGLTSEELDLCTHVCTLPTSERMPSLNLSHSVAVVLGWIAQSRFLGTRGQRVDWATVDEMEALFVHWRSWMVDIGMTVAGNPERILGRVRKLLHRAQLSSREVRILRGILSKAERALRHASGR